MSLNVGDTAPNFELPDTELKLRTLDEFKGKKIVLTFIVAASSPVCETELCTLRDSWQEIADTGAQIVAISNDGPFANKAFAEKHNFNFPLLGDYNSKTISDYDILRKDLLHIKYYNAAKRSVFVIMEDGKIGYKWVSEDPLKYFLVIEIYYTPVLVEVGVLRDPSFVLKLLRQKLRFVILLHDPEGETLESSVKK
mgnify:CR=1 FL=1